MARTALSAVLMASIFAVSGCAPWSGQTTSEYVTVESESGHDTKEARKLYDKARKEMTKHVCDEDSDLAKARKEITKHVRGEECDLAKAEKLLQQALVADVRFGPAHHSLGVLYFWQNKLYLAAWESEYAARLMPDRFEPLNNLGLVYESVGKIDQAKMYYSLAREKAQTNPEVIGNLARASLRSGQTVGEIRPLLEDVLATDTRPEWHRWARELLGIHPKSASPEFCNAPSVECCDLAPMPNLNEPSQAEELPLLTPPSPDTSAPSGAIDQTIKQSFELAPSLDLGTAFQNEMARH